MKHIKYNLFMITDGLKANTTPVTHAFISENYDKAKAYFHDYIKDFKHKISYKLYLIGRITKEGRLQEEKIFIDSGYEIKWTEPKYNLKEEKTRIEKASKAINQREMINYLFGDLRDVK